MFPDLVPAEGSARAPPPARHAATPAIFSPSEHAERRFWEFFTAHIRNRNTRLAYLAAVRRFAEWCERRGLALDQVEPMVVAAYVAQTARTCIYGHLEERNAADPAASHLEMDDNVPGRDHEPGRPRHAPSVMAALAL